MPYPAGGPTDLVARQLAPKLSAKFGQNFIVENVSGGGTNIAGQLVARAAPDGHTHYIANVDGSNVPAGNIAGGFMGAGSHSTPPGRPGTIDDIFQLKPTASTCLPSPGVFGHSFGSGGISTALCDGSVKNISPTISPLTFSRALCPGDGQKLGAEWEED